MQVIASSIGTTSEPWDDPSALHCPVSKDWVFNAYYAAKPVVHSQSPPTSDLIPSEHAASIRLSRDPAVWSSLVNEGTIHLVNRAVTRGNVGRGSEKTGLGRVDFSSVFEEVGEGRGGGASDCDCKWVRVGRWLSSKLMCHALSIGQCYSLFVCLRLTQLFSQSQIAFKHYITHGLLIINQWVDLPYILQSSYLYLDNIKSKHLLWHTMNDQVG